MAKSSQPRPTIHRQDGTSRNESQLSDTAVVRSANAGMAARCTPDPEAVGLFERGMTLLQRHDFNAALGLFDQLQDRFPAEGPLLDRARVYAARCRRELAPPAEDQSPSISTRLTAATAALNNGDDRLAEQLVSSVLDDAANHDHGLYLMAVVHARRGRISAAVDALRHAIAVSPEIRIQARHDADFDALRGHDAFDQVVAAPPAHSDNRNRT